METMAGMVATLSTMIPLGTPAPQFELPDAHGSPVSLDDYPDASAYLVMFICNHCPFVLHIRSEIVRVAMEYQQRGVAVFAINSNDVSKFAADSPDQMAEVARNLGFTFPYLYDETQQVAKDFKAACTPDFFVFDKDLRLTYRGQFDDSRPGNSEPVSGADLCAALDATLDGEPILEECQRPSLGCNIKWKSGNEPDYFKPF